jgi:hypothetical protein
MQDWTTSKNKIYVSLAMISFSILMASTIPAGAFQIINSEQRPVS